MPPPTTLRLQRLSRHSTEPTLFASLEPLFLPAAEASIVDGNRNRRNGAELWLLNADGDAPEQARRRCRARCEYLARSRPCGGTCCECCGPWSAASPAAEESRRHRARFRDARTDREARHALPAACRKYPCPRRRGHRFLWRGRDSRQARRFSTTRSSRAARIAASSARRRLD